MKNQSQIQSRINSLEQMRAELSNHIETLDLTRSQSYNAQIEYEKHYMDRKEVDLKLDILHWLLA